MIRFLDLAAQHEEIAADIDQAVSEVIENCAFIGGRPVANFERDFATYLDAAHCIGVGNGTDALEIAIEALNLPTGSEIIVPGNSFIASSEAVTRAGCSVVFGDVDPKTLTLDPKDVRSRITEKTKAIMPVHLYGQPADMQAFTSLKQELGLHLIEDCAQAHGAMINDKKVGTLGDIATFSFYPGKNLGAYGDGGAVVTSDEALAKKVRMIANHGREDKYDHVFEGRNSRLDGIQAAILSVKLRHLDRWTQHRIDVASWYNERLKDISDLSLQQTLPGSKHVYHLYVVQTTQRNALKQTLLDKEIQCGIHYPIALPKLRAYRHLQQADKSMLVYQMDSKLLSLPMGPHLGEADIDVVCAEIRKFF